MGRSVGDSQLPHAVLVPGPGLGHFNGMLLLARALASSAGFRVTIACFERAYQTHASKGRLANLSSIMNGNSAAESKEGRSEVVRVEVIADGLPPDACSFTDLFHITPSMHHNLLLLLRSSPATCLISDTIMAWTQAVADQLAIPRVEYWTAGATSYLPVLALPHLIAHGYCGSHSGEVPSSWKSKTPVLLDCIPGYSSFPLDEVPSDFRYVTMEDPLLQRFAEAAHLVKKANCLLIHTMHELEHESFEALEHGMHITTFPIGPLIHQSIDTMSSNTTLMWLNNQAPSSVIYVSFGSTVVHTEDEIIELAYGIEASGKPFLWVIRSDALAHGRALADLFPPNFDACIANRGLIVPWVSQLDILDHPAIGGFLSHCGWNSTLESLWMGVPLLTCPKRADQPINNRLIVKDWGVGIELQTTINESTPSRLDIETGIRALLDEPIGDLVRTRAREMKQILRKAPIQGGQSHANLLHFASRMKALRS